MPSDGGVKFAFNIYNLYGGYLILGSKMPHPDSHQQNKLNLYLEVNKINISEAKLKYAPALHRIPEDFNS